MPEILLAAVNACYNHTNIAVRSIALYCGAEEKPDVIGFGEWTINQPVGEILRGIAAKEPKVVVFSTYIWNVEIIQKIIPDIKKILPECKIGMGGPEASFFARGYLEKNPALDFVICGEGEDTTKELCDFFQKDQEFDVTSLEFGKIKGIFSRKFGFVPGRELLWDLSALPFPYPAMDEPDNKIYYYESSRGCPFSCAYCMSSLDKKVRFMPIERVFADIQKFLDANVRLVKFVDRTYNLNEERYIGIWQYILDHHNGKTMFHFEIEAEYLSENAIAFLQKVPSEVMQFEIGVQSANPRTLKAVGRSDNVETLFKNVQRIPSTIHSHLDLIAGLPFEDLESFGRSFDFVMKMKPDALQLGFLKVLHGTDMEEYSEKNGWKWMENPPYETLSTPYLSYEEIVYLKDVETMVDAFWNSGEFCKTMSYLGRTMGFWKFFCKAVDLGREFKAFDQPRKDVYWFGFLFDHATSFADFADVLVLQELIRFDFIEAKKSGRFPQWFDHRYDRDGHTLALQSHGGIQNTRLDYAYSDYDEFFVNPLCDRPEDTVSEGKCYRILFVYPRREKDNPDGNHNIKKQILL